MMRLPRFRYLGPRWLDDLTDTRESIPSWIQREPWRIAHPLREVLLLVVCGTIASCDDFDDIAEWGEQVLFAGAGGPDRDDLRVRGEHEFATEWRAIAQIEAEFGIDGENGLPFSGTRNTGVGVASPFGTLILGRWDSPMKQTTIGLDPFGLLVAPRAEQVAQQAELLHGEAVAGREGRAVLVVVDQRQGHGEAPREELGVSPARGLRLKVAAARRPVSWVSPPILRRYAGKSPARRRT